MSRKSRGESVNCECTFRTGAIGCACTESVYFPAGAKIPDTVICSDCRQGKHQIW